MSWVAIGVGVVGAGVSLYGASQAGKGSGQSRSTGELGRLPYKQQRQEAQAYADAQFGLNQRQAQLALQYGPAFAQQQNAQAENMAKALLKLYPGFAAAEIKATSKTRTGDLADFSKNAGGWYDALNEASPAYKAIGDTVAQGEGSPLLDYLNYQAFTAGPSELRTELEQRALDEVRLGGQLSPEAQRLGEQQARSAWSDRGLLYSNGAVGAEILNRDYLAQQRQRERQQWGATVQGLAFNEDQGNRQFGLNVQGANEASAGNWRNFLVAGSQAQLNPMLQAGMQRTAVNPMSLLGLYQGQQGAATAASVFGTAPSIAQGVQSLVPLYNYSNDVNSTNFAAGESRANAQANAYSAVGAGLMGSASGLYGSQIRAGTTGRGLYY